MKDGTLFLKCYLFTFFLPYNEKKVIFISRGLHIYEIFSYILSQEIFEKLSHNMKILALSVFSCGDNKISCM